MIGGEIKVQNYKTYHIGKANKTKKEANKVK